jgi:hypothetical protein
MLRVGIRWIVHLDLENRVMMEPENKDQRDNLARSVKETSKQKGIQVCSYRPKCWRPGYLKYRASETS